MSAITEIGALLSALCPQLSDIEYVFCSVDSHSYKTAQIEQLEPLATFRESEGLSLVIRKEQAIDNGLAFSGAFKCITLKVHSSLDAIGLTAAVAGKLATEGISANVIAAFYHDHVLVPAARAEDALSALEKLSAVNKN